MPWADRVDEMQRHTQHRGLPHCSLRTEYVVGGRKALFDIRYNSGEPLNLYDSTKCLVNVFNNA